MKALGAVAVIAALALPTIAVGQQLLDGGDIRNSSLTGKDVRNRSLTKADFRGSVRGPRGPQGAPGPQGPPGPVNLGRIVRVTASKTIPPGVDSVSVSCPAGYAIVSGGNSVISAEAVMFYEDTFGSRTSWTVGVDNFGASTNADATAIAFCAPGGAAVTPAKRSNVRERIAALEARQVAAHR